MDKPADDERRALERVWMRSDKPVYIHTSLDGVAVGLLVENLSALGATLICPQGSISLGPGQHLAECELVLPGGSPVPVAPMIQWCAWPKIGVQFMGISKESQGQILRFLQVDQENRLRG